MTRSEPLTEDRSFDAADAVLRIDLSALKSNYLLLKERAAPAECAACVKADAYGLGVEHVVPALAQAGCSTFFVAHAAEGVQVRDLLADARIYVLHGVWPGTEEMLHAHRLTPVINSLEQLDTWAAYARARGSDLDAALHLDTGMSRLGLDQAELADLAGDPGRMTGIALTLVMSHLCCGEDRGNKINRDQLQRFNKYRAMLAPCPASLAASSGIFLGPEFNFDLVRAGIALYGGQPTLSGANPMREVVRASARVLQVRDVDSPQTVGYGAAHKVTKPSRIATVSVGYADGYMRSLGGRGYACIDGNTAPLVGCISMDLITLDVSALPRDRTVPGVYADIIGGGAQLDEIAELAGTISYEILTRLGGRFRRHYVDGIP